MIITLGGLAGTGTTTAAKKLSEFLNIPFISAGDVFRQLAVEHNMSLLEFNEFAEGNDEIDIELDKRQVKIAKESDNLIVEGRLSAHFVDADYKIWLMAPDHVRAERICDRENKSLETVNYEIKERTVSEKKRYLEIHNINIDDLSVYDLIINTGTFDADSTANIIIQSIKKINR
ncbi:MAG: cytidylate kinase [Methanosphaera stadtmanae]|jgi:cytidylate kinase|nr:cytidylate kinase [Methanosphaera stadtmanae]